MPWTQADIDTLKAAMAIRPVPTVRATGAFTPISK